MLSGSSGLGKTVLAEAIAGEMDAVLREFSGSSISSDAALVKALTTINEGDVLIVKDIHKLNIVKMKYFSQPLKRFEIDLDIMDSTIHLELPHFTMIATTNQPDLLADEVRNAFDIQLELESNVVENIHLRKGNRVCFNSLPFVSLYIANVIGYYDAQGNAFFVSDRNMDADFKDDIVLIKKSSALDSVFKNVSEFTISPCLCVGRKRGVYYVQPSETVELLLERDVERKAKKVNAPFLPSHPLTVECRVEKQDPWLLEARIINVSADTSILDDEGNIDPTALFHELMYLRMGDYQENEALE